MTNVKGSLQIAENWELAKSPAAGIDLGAIPTEPMATVLERFAREHFASDAQPVSFATTQEQMMAVPGYMAGKSRLPHVAVEFYPNIFIARVEFLSANDDINGDEMHCKARCVEIREGGYSFLRFVRTAK